MIYNYRLTPLPSPRPLPLPLPTPTPSLSVSKSLPLEKSRFKPAQAVDMTDTFRKLDHPVIIIKIISIMLVAMMNDCCLCLWPLNVECFTRMSVTFFVFSTRKVCSYCALYWRNGIEYFSHLRPWHGYNQVIENARKWLCLCLVSVIVMSICSKANCSFGFLKTLIWVTVILCVWFMVLYFFFFFCGGCWEINC